MFRQGIVFLLSINLPAGISLYAFADVPVAIFPSKGTEAIVPPSNRT